MFKSPGLPVKAAIVANSVLAGTLSFAQTQTGTTSPTDQTEKSNSPTPATTGTDESPNLSPNSIPAPAEGIQAKKKVERIQVTGSRIKRTESETSSAVSVISKSQIEKSGTASLGEFFRKSASASPTGNFTGSSEFVSSGSGTIDLLGLGAERTLVLVNGKRLPTLAGLGAVNVETIPTALVEKIEILSGGASAVYGADAVGGVVNIVTRKELTGTELTASITVPIKAGGEEQAYGVSQGIKITDDFNIALATGWRHRNAIDNRNRNLKASFPERANTLYNAPNGTYSYQPVTLGATPDDSIVGNWTPSPNCPIANQITTNPQEPNNKYCAGPRSELGTELIPEQENWYVATTFDSQLNSTWNLQGLFSFTAAKSTSNSGRSTLATDPLTDNPIAISNATATRLGVPVDPTASYVQIYGPTPESQEQFYVNSDTTFMSGLYLTGALGEGWNSSFSLSYAASTGKRNGQHLLNKELRSAILLNPNTPNNVDPAYIPIDPSRDINLLGTTTADLKSEEWAENFSGDAFASKELFQLPGGAFSFGLGAAYSFERFKQTPDTRDLLKASNNEPLYVGTFANAGKGSRTVASLYTEFFAPIVKQLDVDGALRFDAFQDVDPSLNYGLGLKYKMIPEAAFRARAASSYKAPPLAYVHQKGGGGYLPVNDPYNCARENDQHRFCDPDNPSRMVYVESPGNDNLNPEVGVNYSIGMVLEPLQGLNIISDYYWVFLSKTFQVDDLQRVVDRWYAANGNSTTSGKQGDNTVQVDKDGVITQLGTPYRNLGRTHVRVWASKANYQFNFAPFLLGMESEYTRMLSYKIQEAEGLPTRQHLGFFGLPAWRWNNSIDFGTQNHMGTVSSRTIGRQYADPVESNAWEKNIKVGVYTEYDAVYSAQLPWNSTLQAGVNNVFNTLGGVIEATAIGAQDLSTTSLYSYQGRAFFARYSQRL